MMPRLTTAALAVLVAAGFAAPAHSEALVAYTKDFTAFHSAFCDAPRDGEYFFVLPVNIFEEHKTFDCADGTYTLRTTPAADDPGHMLYNVDPPHAVANGFDCDAKADTGMQSVAINCIPADLEQEGHSKT
ncbi:MAG: hypothetical protein AAGJ94_09130 [Pseudomonadota bacterium]